MNPALVGAFVVGAIAIVVVAITLLGSGTLFRHQHTYVCYFQSNVNGLHVGAPVKFRDRDRCHACHRKAARAALKRPCPGCGRVRHLRPAGICAVCDLPTRPARPAKIITCRECGPRSI